MSRAQDAPSVPRVEGAEPPTEHAAPRQSDPASVAGGLPAVRSAMAHAVEHAGLVHGTRALLGVNQRKGFDCPGCAWPDPQHRSAFEFCENGAKAIAVRSREGEPTRPSSRSTAWRSCSLGPTAR